MNNLLTYLLTYLLDVLARKRCIGLLVNYQYEIFCNNVHNNNNDYNNDNDDYDGNNCTSHYTADVVYFVNNYIV